MKKHLQRILPVFATLFLLPGLNLSAQKIQATYTPASFSGPFSGKVLLYLSKELHSPKDAIDNIPAFCCFAITVKDIRPNTPVTFDDAAIAYPVMLSDIERGEYYAQVVWDRNTGGRNIGSSPDNMYNLAVKLHFTKNFKQKFSIVCDSVIPHPGFEELPYMKELKAHSSLLTAFYNRETTVDGAVNLPAEYYRDTTRRFPVELIVLGYGGDYHWNSGDTAKAWPLDSFPCIRVFLDGNCPWGHSTYANSVNTGPWGDALVNEFIPELEKKFRCNGARFVSGHSSGGWSSLWLQVNYPKTFAGCWSSSPDPVDFRCYEMVNLYKDKNLFYDQDSALRVDGCVAGYSGLPWIFFKDDYRIENVLWRGEQYWSWNAVWGGKRANGLPENICDPVTGAIDSAVASHWKKYDISLILRSNWSQLKPDLDHKIRVTAGKSDNYALDKAVLLLEQEMKKTGADMTFAYYPGDHFTVWTNPGFDTDGKHFLALRYADWLKQHPGVKR